MKALEAGTCKGKLSLLNKVLVAVDLSEHSAATASYAAELANCFGASLTLVHVHDPVPLYEYASETTCTILDEQRDDLCKRLRGLTERLRKMGVACDAFFLDGDPAQQISAFAEEINADLIVIGGHRSTLLGRFFNLDKAPQIRRRVRRPVLIYPETIPN